MQLQYDGTLCKEHHVTQSCSMTLEMLSVTYLGTEKFKDRAEEVLFWQGKNVANEVSKCEICSQFLAKEPKSHDEISDCSWCKNGLDLFELIGKDYLSEDNSLHFLQLSCCTPQVNDSVT